MKKPMHNSFGKSRVLFCVFIMANSFPFSLSIVSMRNDVTPPVIIINFAGNLTDKGGPAYRMGDPDHMLPNGYYTNDSRQQEYWIYINITVNGTGSNPNIVALHWCQRNGQIISWNNDTWTFIRTGPTGKPYEFYYEFDSKGNITIPGDGSWYSFDVFANDQSGLISVKRWEKNGLGYTVTRRYVQLGCSPRNISYSPFYVLDYTSGSGIYGLGDYGQPDDLHHDQGGAYNSNDTGYINSTLPRDELQFRRCGAFVGLWFEDSVCTQPMQLRNIYFHFWWSTLDGVMEKIGWKKNRKIPVTTFDDYYTADATQSRSDLFVDNHDTAYSDNYHLSTQLLKIINARDYNFTDNDVYELCIQLVAFGQGGQDFPNVIANRSILSFVLFNVPDNSTLTRIDNDNDLLSDYTELYETYTSPFVSDTDNDGWSDYDELEFGTDPNNYTDKLEPQTSISDLRQTQGIEFDPIPYVSDHGSKVLYLWPFAGDPPACEPYPHSYLATAALGPTYTYSDNHVSQGPLGIRIGNYAGEDIAFPSTNVTLFFINNRGGSLTVYLPEIDLPYRPFPQNIYFWVADDGSTFYANSNHDSGCPDMSPTEAITPEHLARKAE